MGHKPIFVIIGKGPGLGILLYKAAGLSYSYYFFVIGTSKIFFPLRNISYIYDLHRHKLARIIMFVPTLLRAKIDVYMITH